MVNQHDTFLHILTHQRLPIEDEEEAFNQASAHRRHFFADRVRRWCRTELCSSPRTLPVFGSRLVRDMGYHKLFSWGLIPHRILTTNCKRHGIKRTPIGIYRSKTYLVHLHETFCDKRGCVHNWLSYFAAFLATLYLVNGAGVAQSV